MLQIIKNTALGGAIMCIIALIAYYVPHAELILLAVAFLALAYGIGTIIEGVFIFNKSSKKTNRELLNG